MMCHPKPIRAYEERERERERGNAVSSTTGDNNICCGKMTKVDMCTNYLYYYSMVNSTFSLNQ